MRKIIFASLLFALTLTFVTGAGKVDLVTGQYREVDTTTDTTGITDSTDKRFCTDAQKVVIGNTSGSNTGNETAASIGTLTNGAGAITTPVDTDMIGLTNSGSSNIWSHLSWANTKATLKTYFDGIYATGQAKNTANLVSISTTGSDHVGDYVCDGTADQTEFATAIAAMKAGDTLIVYPGTYTFSDALTVDKSISIVGVDRSLCIINIVGNYTGLNITSSGVSIQYLKFATTAGQTVASAAVTINGCDKISVSSCWFASSIGVAIAGTSSYPFIRENYFEAAAAPVGLMVGVSLSSACVVSYASIQQNLFYLLHFAVKSANSNCGFTNSIITENYIRGYDGMSFINASNSITISDNYIYFLSNFGIGFVSTGIASANNINISIHGNNITGHTGTTVGVVLKAMTDVNFSGNIIKGPASAYNYVTMGDGQAGQGVIRANITGNSFNGSTSLGITESGASDYNVLSGNSNPGTVTLAGANSIDRDAAVPAASVTVTDDTTTNATYYPTFSTTTTDSGIKVSSSKMTYNPSTGRLTATSFAGDGSALTGVNASVPEPTSISGATTTYTLTSADNGKLLTNAGLEGMTIQFDTLANLGANFQVSIVNETGLVVPPTALIYLNFDATGQVITDKSRYNRNVSVAGGAVQSATQSKYGGKSLAILSAGDHTSSNIDSDYINGTQDWTIEFWVYQASWNADKCVFSMGNAVNQTANTISVACETGGGNKFQIECYDSAATQKRAASTMTLNTETWYHVALVRYGNDLKLYIGGAEEATVDVTSSTFNMYGLPLRIGDGKSDGSMQFAGYVDDFAMYNYAKYTAAFTAPTIALYGAYPLTIIPASGETLPVASAADRKAVSTGRNDYLAIRTTDTGIIATSVYPAAANWVDTASEHAASTVTVADAGTTAVNGEYTYAGMYQTRPMFSFGVYDLYYYNTGWVIAGTGAALYTHTDDGSTPPTSSWDISTGDSPAPGLTLNYFP